MKQNKKQKKRGGQKWVEYTHEGMQWQRTSLGAYCLPLTTPGIHGLFRSYVEKFAGFMNNYQVYDGELLFF